MSAIKYFLNWLSHPANLGKKSFRKLGGRGVGEFGKYMRARKRSGPPGSSAFEFKEALQPNAPSLNPVDWSSNRVLSTRPGYPE
jgi:hypothetical protein